MSAAPATMTAKVGWLHHLDPRAKLWIALLVITSCLLTKQLWALGLLLMGMHLVLLGGGVSLTQIGRAWRGLAVILLFVMVGQPLLLSGKGTLLFQIGPVAVTEPGVLTALQYALRLSAAAFASLIPILTTPTHVLVRGLEKLGLPYNWGITIGLALHYLGTLGDLYTTISEAQQARGLDLSQRGLIKRARLALPTLVALIIASLRLSDSLALGLASRGFGLDNPRTAWQDITFKRADWLVVIAGGVLFAGFAVITLATTQI